ncbi:porin family protein [Microbulbifer sp. EKSA008]|uniref:porin family protein n=1 Tax=unclassified Microbulbifer TaxID=2619833 RepID=UPI00403A72E4
MKISKLCLLLPALAISALSTAEENPFYFGVGYGQQDFEGKSNLSVDFIDGERFKDQSNSIDIYAGYQINPYFSVEAGYSHYDKAADTYTYNLASINDKSIDSLDENPLSNNYEEIQVDSAQLNAVFHYPILDRATMSAYLGLAYTSIDSELRFPPGTVSIYPEIVTRSSDKDYDLAYGLGVKYDFTDRFAGKLQWKNIDNGTLEISGLHLSLETRF